MAAESILYRKRNPVPSNNKPARVNVNDNINLRFQSNNRPSNTGPRKLPNANGSMNSDGSATP